MNDSDKEQGVDLAHLTLQEVLERNDLNFEELFAIKDVHNKIKRQTKIFVDYCRAKPLFTSKFIQLGLKFTVDQNTPPNIKNLAFISADILTSDHETLADLFIMPIKSTPDSDEDLNNDEEIEEEIETEDSGAAIIEEKDKYRYLVQILEYVNNEQLDENCLNYISKALQTLVRKKINQFLQFFNQFPIFLQKISAVSHFPSISHLLSKLMIDDDDNLTSLAHQTRSKIIPLILNKIHKQITKIQTHEVFQCIDQILQSTRYGQPTDRSDTQKLSDLIVSQTQISFHLDQIKYNLSIVTKTQQNLYSLNNSLTYLTLIVTRMNMDQQQDYSDQPKEFTPNLTYELDQLFLSFCQIVNLYPRITQFQNIDKYIYRLIPVKCMDLLTTMIKHSRFQSFYIQVQKIIRLQSISVLVTNLSQHKIKGILLLQMAQLLQKLLTQQQKIVGKAQAINWISYDQIYQLIFRQSKHIDEQVKIMTEQTTNKRNRNQNHIYLRKLLVLVDNYMNNDQIVKSRTVGGSIGQLFPSFNVSHCKGFAEITAISNHPGGIKIKQVEQFAFIRKNKIIIEQTAVEVVSKEVQEKESQQGNETVVALQVRQQQIEQNVINNKTQEVVLKLQGKIKARKDKVKDRDKDIPSNQLQPLNISNSQEHKPQPKANQLGLHYFIRHLLIF